MAESLRRKSLAGLGWAFGQQAGSQLSRVVFSILLARVLSPSDYGLLGLGLLCVNFLQILSTFGLGDGLIQLGRKADESELVTLFRLHAVLALAATGLLFIAAPWVAAWYHLEGLTNVLRLLAFNFVFSIGVVIPRAVLEKTLSFRTVARRAVPATLASGLLALWAAHAGWGVYSLVVLAMAEPALMAFSLLPWIPRGKPAPLARLRSVLQYSWKLALASALGFIGKNIDAVVIGRWIGPAQLGLYQMGFRLTRLPTQNLAAVLDRVLFPSFSSIQSDHVRVARAYSRVMRGLSLLTMPLMTVVAFSLGTIIPLLLTGTWLEAIPVMQVFCVMAMIQTLGRGKNAIVQALGRSDLVLVWVFLAAPVDILTVALSARHGILAVATWLVIVRGGVELIQMVVIARLLETPFRHLALSAAAGLPLALALTGLALLLEGLGWPAALRLGLLAVAASLPLLVLVAVKGQRGALAWLVGDSGS